MKKGQERHNNLHPKGATHSSLRGNTTLVRLASRFLCLLILVLNNAIGLAQAPSSNFKWKDKNVARLDRARRLAYHTRFLRQVAKSSPRIEVVWSMEKVYPSLRYIAENGSDQDNEAAKAAASIFSRTENTLARDLCLSALKKIGNKVARRELLRIYNDTSVPAEWRTTCAEYLGMPSPQSSPAGATAGSHTKISP